MDLQDRDQLYAAIKGADSNAAAHALSTAINRAHNAALRTAHNEAAQQAQDNQPAIDDSIKAALERLNMDSTSDDILAGARALFIAKLRTGDIKAADLKAFQDAISSGDDDYTVTLVDFASVLDTDAPMVGLSEEAHAHMRTRLRESGWDALVGKGTALPAQHTQSS